MSHIFAELLTLAKKVNNYIEDATDNAATNAKFTSTTTQEWTVPTGKRWFVLGGNFNWNVSATAIFQAHDSSDKIIGTLMKTTAITGDHPWPSILSSVMVSGDHASPWILDAGEYVKVTAGAAQGATATASCVVLEIDV